MYPGVHTPPTERIPFCAVQTILYNIALKRSHPSSWCCGNGVPKNIPWKIAIFDFNSGVWRGVLRVKVNAELCTIGQPARAQRCVTRRNESHGNYIRERALHSFLRFSLVGSSSAASRYIRGDVDVRRRPHTTEESPTTIHITVSSLYEGNGLWVSVCGCGKAYS